MTKASIYVGGQPFAFCVQTFKNLVVLGENGDLGSWTGFQWKGRRVTGVTFSKITHDPVRAQTRRGIYGELILHRCL